MSQFIAEYIYEGCQGYAVLGTFQARLQADRALDRLKVVSTRRVAATRVTEHVKKDAWAMENEGV